MKSFMKILGFLIGLTILFQAVVGFNLPQTQVASSRGCRRQQSGGTSSGSGNGGGYSDGGHNDGMSGSNGQDSGSSTRSETSGGGGHK